jgi:DNA-binding MarR family transcriptional regulator
LLGYHPRRASSAFAPHLRGQARRGLIRPGLFGILSIVFANPGINQSRVRDALGIERANMVALINELVDKGFLKRVTPPNDRRTRSLTVTRTGEAKLASILELIARLEGHLTVNLSKKERRTLVGLLARINVKPHTQN